MRVKKIETNETFAKGVGRRAAIEESLRTTSLARGRCCSCFAPEVLASLPLPPLLLFAPFGLIIFPVSPAQLQAEQQQRWQLRQGARVVQPDGQGGPGHAHPDPAPGAPVRGHALSPGTRHAVGARVPGHFRGGRLGPGPVRGAAVLLLQRRGECTITVSMGASILISTYDDGSETPLWSRFRVPPSVVSSPFPALPPAPLARRWSLSRDLCTGGVRDEETVATLQRRVVDPVPESYVRLAATPSPAVGDRGPANAGDRPNQIRPYGRGFNTVFLFREPEAYMCCRVRTRRNVYRTFSFKALKKNDYYYDYYYYNYYCCVPPYTLSFHKMLFIEYYYCYNFIYFFFETLLPGLCLLKRLRLWSVTAPAA